MVIETQIGERKDNEQYQERFCQRFLRGARLTRTASVSFSIRLGLMVRLSFRSAMPNWYCNTIISRSLSRSDIRLIWISSSSTEKT